MKDKDVPTVTVADADAVDGAGEEAKAVTYPATDANAVDTADKPANTVPSADSNSFFGEDVIHGCWCLPMLWDTESCVVGTILGKDVFGVSILVDGIGIIQSR